MNATLRLARPPTLTQMAVDQLRDAIVSGLFQPGERLVEMDLSVQLGVSRAPLREAFRILASEGLIELKQNRGCTVVNPSVEELEQMVLFRALIEGAAARLVTTRADEAVFDRLASFHQAMIGSRKMKNNLPFLEAYWEFHRTLLTSSGNAFLLQSWNQIGDFGVVSRIADRVVVMYAGRAVESGPVASVLSAPHHPYSAGLIASVPSNWEKGRLRQIQGEIPDLTALPAGCSFRPRCDRAFARCEETLPNMITIEAARRARCWLYADA